MNDHFYKTNTQKVMKVKEVLEGVDKKEDVTVVKEEAAIGTLTMKRKANNYLEVVVMDKIYLCS